MKSLKKRIGQASLDAMKGQLLNGFQTKFNSKILLSGWVRVPSVLEFKHIVGEFNQILKSIGINYRFNSKVSYKLNRTNHMNRYIEHQLRRLERAKKISPELYGKIAFSCMLRSRSFRFSAIHRIIPRGHTTMTISEVMRINRKVQKILFKGITKMKYQRVYIPKKDSFRPLGVPTVEGRIVLHMGNNMLHGYLKDTFLPSQHGFLPGRGTLSAGQDIIKNALKAKYIYEVDLRQFFPSVDVRYISEMLNGKNFVPLSVTNYLQQLNLSAPTLPDDELLDESHLKLKRGLNLVEDNKGGITQNIFWTQNNRMGVNSYNNIFKGVPQGAPTSPLLSILTLKDFLSQIPSISYADDMIFYSDHEFELGHDPDNGIEINEEKSDGVKKDGLGLKPLKFLGVVYDGNKLYGDTRKGPKSYIPEDLIELGKDMRYNENDNFLEDVSRRNFFGFIMSCLYTNNGKNEGSVIGKEVLRLKNEKLNNKSLFGRYIGSNGSSLGYIYLSNIFDKYPNHTNINGNQYNKRI